MAARIEPHLTLIHDVVDHDQVEPLVGAAAEATAPFTVRLTGAAHWGRPIHGIYLVVDDPAGHTAALHGRLAELEDPAWSRGSFRPHVTVVHGRTVTADAAHAAWLALDGFHAGWDVVVDAIDVLELVEPRWRLVGRVPLTGRDGGAGA